MGRLLFFNKYNFICIIADYIWSYVQKWVSRGYNSLKCCTGWFIISVTNFGILGDNVKWKCINLGPITLRYTTTRDQSFMGVLANSYI